MKNVDFKILGIIVCLLFALTSFGQIENPTKEEPKEQIQKPSTTLSTPTKDKVDPPDEMPRFPGCEDKGGSIDKKEKCAQTKMLEYVYKNLRYPASARNNKVDGMVIVGFNVSTEGMVTDFVIKKDIGDGCGEAVLDVLRKMKEEIVWRPGMKDGKPVVVPYTLPVLFRVAR